MEKLKIAVIGQSQFAAEVYKKVKENGHEVVGKDDQISPAHK